MKRIRQAAVARLIRWSARRHGRDALPLTVERRRIYIVPTRFGLTLALLLVAMLVAGLNYNSNLGLGFAFLMVSLTLVAMHHCHRNLLGLSVDVVGEADAFAGGRARFDFVLQNTGRVERRGIEIHCGADAAATVNVPAQGFRNAAVEVDTAQRGVLTFSRFEIRTRHPFGWFRAWTYVQSPIVAFVAPQPRGDRMLPPAIGTAGPSAPAGVPGDESFAGLRAYQAGMPLKHMAWKVLARGADPAVRSYTGQAAAPEWLTWASLDRLESEGRLAQLCRWVVDCESARRSYGLRIPGREIHPAHGAAHRRACLRALAAFPGAAP